MTDPSPLSPIQEAIALRWDLDATETASRTGFEQLDNDVFEVSCSFRDDTGELRRLGAKQEAGIPHSAIEDLKWSVLLISGEMTMPSAECLANVGATPSGTSFVVTATTKGHSRWRWHQGYAVTPGETIAYQIVVPRCEARGRLTVTVTLVLSQDQPMRPGFAHRAFTRLTDVKPVTIDLDRIEGVPGSSMPIVWDDFGSDRALFRLDLDSNDDGEPIIRVRLNKRDQALRMVLDSTDGDETRSSARRLLHAIIASEVLTQLTLLAKQRRNEMGAEDGFYLRLRSTLHRKGVPEEAIELVDTVDGLIDVNYRIQNNLQVHSLASKMVGLVATEEDADDSEA